MGEQISIDRELLQTVLDIAISSLDFGSGFLDNSEVEALRTVAEILGVDPILATPGNFVCQYKGQHEWVDTLEKQWAGAYRGRYWCSLCHHVVNELPTAAENPG